MASLLHEMKLMTDLIKAAMFAIAIGCLFIWALSVCLALIIPGLWPTYQIIIDKYTWPALTLAVGLLAGYGANGVRRLTLDRKTVA